MKQRVEVGTDVAQIGVWDESRASEPLPKRGVAKLNDTMSADTESGRLFLLQLEGDWGGAIDVYVDTAIVAGHSDSLKRLPGAFLLSAPTGRIVVGGAEDYRSAQPQITSESSVVKVPPGEYEISCYILKPEIC